MVKIGCAPSHIHEKTANSPTTARQLECFCSSKMENQPDGPQEEDVEEPDETEEKLHVYPRLLSDLDLEQVDVDSKEHGGREREKVSQYWARVFFTEHKPPGP